MHTNQEKLDAAIAAMTKAGWPVEYHNGEPLLLSEGNLGVACFNAGYEFAAAATYLDLLKRTVLALKGEPEEAWVEWNYHLLPRWAAEARAALAPAPAATSISGGEELVALTNKLYELAFSAASDEQGKLSAYDHMRLLADSRAKLTAGIRALAAAPASVTSPQEPAADNKVVAGTYWPANVLTNAKKAEILLRRYRQPELADSIDMLKHTANLWRIKIIALKKELAATLTTSLGGEKTGGWVKTSERLPEIGAKVLMLYGPHDYTYQGHMEVGYRVQPDPTGNWWWAGLETLPTADLISHWLPLPTAPSDAQ